MRSLLVVLIVICSLSASAQKKDTTVKAKQDSVQVLAMNVEQIQGLLRLIDSKIDSKKESNEIYAYLYKFIFFVRAAPPANKPKQ